MRLGIMGAGDSARSFAGASHVVDGVELVAIAGRDMAEAAAVTQTCGGKPTTFDAMIDENLDCVAISTPPGLRCEHVLPFFDKGVAAMVEKPLALSVAACDRLIDAAARAEVKLMVTQTHRYKPYGRKAKAIVESRRFGRVHSVQVYLGHDYFTAKRSGWQLDPALSGGGVTFNPFIHMIDFARYMAGGEVVSFTGSIGHHKPGYAIEGDVRCLAQFDNGASAFVHVDGYGHRRDHTVDVFMDGGVMLIRPMLKRIEVMVDGRVAESHGFGDSGVNVGPGVYAEHGYVGQITEMRDAIEHGGPLTSDGRNGRANVAIAEQLLQREHRATDAQTAGHP